MKLTGWQCILSVALVWGCASQDSTVMKRGTVEPRGLNLGGTNVTVTPRPVILGKVTMVNAELRFVVIDFLLGGVPSRDRRLGVYRAGERVAEVKISGPQSESLIAADVTEGTVQVGDEVKEE